MTTFDQIDAALRTRCWRYDVENEVFRDKGRRRLDYGKILALVPDLTLDELASYQDDKFDQLRARMVKG